MTEYEAIFKRLSVRNYSTKEISVELQQEISDYFKQLEPFDDTAEVFMEWKSPQEVFQNARGVNVQSPYYLVFRAPKSRYDRENVGYLGEQVVLHLVTLGIGSCWIGGARAKYNFRKDYVIVLAVGYPREDIRFRNGPEDFQRKPAEHYCASVVEGDLFAEALDAARLAPSGMNFQPLRYEALTSHMHLLRKSPPVPFILDNMQRIDAGIGLAHVAVCMRNAGRRCRIGTQPAPSASRFQYVTSVTVLPEEEE